MVHIKYISLVNLILDEPLVKELIQNDLTTRNLSHELDRILKDKSAREKILQGYESLQLKLGGSGASSRTARLIIQYLTEKLTN